MVAFRQRLRASSSRFGGEVTSTATRFQAPADLLAVRPEFIAAPAAGVPSPTIPPGRSRCMAYFRRAGDGWTLVGLERNP